MAALTRVSGQVRPNDDKYRTPATKIAGEALAAGDALYIKNTDRRVYKASAAASGTAKVIGFAPTDVAIGEPVAVMGRVVLSGFSGLTAGAPVFLSDTAGVLADAAGTVVVVLGQALNATSIEVDGILGCLAGHLS